MRVSFTAKARILCIKKAPGDGGGWKPLALVVASADEILYFGLVDFSEAGLDEGPVHPGLIQ